MDDPNQFIIHSQGKEHIFTAETHESTMIWLLALQAKRDTFNNRLTLMVEQNSHEIKEKEDHKRKESLPSDHEIQQMISRAKCAENGCMENGLKDLQDEDNLGGISGLLRSKSVRENRPTSVSYFSTRFRDHLFRNTCSDQHRRSVDLGTVSSSLCNARTSPVIYRLRNCSGGSVPNTDSDDTDTSAGRSCPHSPNILPEIDGSIGSDTPELFMSSGTPPLGMESTGSNCLTTLQANLDLINSTQLNSQIQSSSMNNSTHNNNTNGICAITDRLKELEIDLLTSKLEIAKALNREAILKDELEGKESTIHQLESQLKEKNEKRKTSLEDNIVVNASSQRLHEKCRILQNQNRYLNEEVLKLSRMWQQEQMKYLQLNQKFYELKVELDRMKRDYVFVLQSSIRVTGGDGPELIEVPIYGGSRSRKRISKLLEEARKSNPVLPSLEGMAKLGCHVDSFGFKHCYMDEGLMLHYLCGQLNNHYNGHLSTAEHNQRRWKEILKQSETSLPRTKEIKNLVRSGIPNHFRAKVWGLLIQDKVKSVKESKGPLYYDHLRSLMSESEVVLSHRRQISLDLLRTMPNNVHFNDIEADGVKKMQDVLQAFCLHSPSVGYCQGMNFIVGMALLFMKAEDAFWFLVAITERYFPPYYFDQNLMGAQADQEVLKDVMAFKLPTLAKHFNILDIELSTVTLNWFLAIFFDSIPFECLLRIWDCFLYEGPKVLFRFSLAILKMNESTLLDKSNTISIMRQLKASSRFCFDIDGLIKTAFEDLKPFPRRAEIVSKQTCYLKTLKEKLKKRNIEKEALENKEKMFDSHDNTSCGYVIECCATDEDHVWICEGTQQKGRIVKVSCREETKEWLDIQLESRIMCIHVMRDSNLIFLGGLAHCLYIYNASNKELVSCIKLNDAVLDICSHEDGSRRRLYVALADGTIAIAEWPTSESSPVFQRLDIFYIMIGSSGVSCLKLVERRLWCASGNRIVILHALTLDTIDQFTVSTNCLDTIASILENKFGVWILMRGSHTFQLWDPQNLVCRLQFNTNNKQSSSFDEMNSPLNRLTAILPMEKSIWVGTGDGHILIYDIQLIPSRKTSAFNSPGHRIGSDCPSLDLVNEKIQELYEQQSGQYDDRLKCTRGRSDSGYQTVGDASKESSVITQRNDDVIADNDDKSNENDVKNRRLCIMEMAADESDDDDDDSDGQIESWTSTTVKASTGNNSNQSSSPTLMVDKVKITNSTSTEKFENLKFPSKQLQLNLKMDTDDVRGFGSYTHVKSRRFKNVETSKIKYKGFSRSISDIETYSNKTNNNNNSNNKGQLPLNKFIRSQKKICRSFDEISHLLGGSGESVVSSPSCGSFDFDDVFVTYAEEDKSLNHFKVRETLQRRSKIKTGHGQNRIRSISDFSTSTTGNSCNSSSGVEEPIVPMAKKHEFQSRTKSHQFNNKFITNKKPEMKKKLSLPLKTAAHKGFESSLDENEQSSNVEYESSKDSKRFLTVHKEVVPSEWNYFKESDSGSFVSLSECDIPYSVELVLREKIKVSDKSVKCLVAVEKKGEPSVIYSCSESSHEPDAIMQWTLMNLDGTSKEIWHQKSVVDASHRRPSVPTQIRRAPSPSMILVNSDFSLSVTSTSIVNATSSLVGNGIAKVQNMISNFSADP
ncbi:hypothetical protein CHUAL_006062 [Chamberlinius hualienensis]